MNKKLQRLLVISNRLPVSVAKEDGKLVFKESYGGLATGLASLGKSNDKLWIGWPGIASDDLSTGDVKAIITELKKHNCVPVFLSQKQVDEFYFGYCNSTIWPLFHYFTQHTEYTADSWSAYQEVNQLFCDASTKYIDKETTVWVHDFQLMLLPQLLRQTEAELSIGFFLHIPFPSFEIFRLLPNRAAILRGMLGADLIGFHTYSYTRHFLSSVLRILGHTNDLGTIKVDKRFVRADAFPIGIDYRKYASAPKQPVVKKEIANLKKYYKQHKIILSFDRLDYSKGILERLKAYDLFLDENPEYIDKVVMIMIATPSRMQVLAYESLRKEIEQTVSRINGKYSRIGWAPISYQYRSVPFEQVTALYDQADVALITPLRDGLNLIAKEYVATNQDGEAVLILSEMAGAASELPEAIQVNPNNQELVALAIKKALELPAEERKQRMKTMQKRISNYDIKKWTSDFLGQLSLAKDNQQKQLHKDFTEADKKLLVKAYQKAKARLFLLDYDGTLVDFVSDPSHLMAVPSQELKDILSKLRKSEEDEVVIVSGRPKDALEAWFGDLPLSLVAEHGGWVKENDKWIVRQSESQAKWKKIIRPILEYYVDRTAGSFIEEKDFALVWHYRKVSPSLAGVRKAELRHDIMQAIKNSEIGLFEGSKIFEVKPKHIHKGTIARQRVDRQKWDFILSIGDDYTDEDIFTSLPSSAFTIKVGFGHSVAKFHLATTQEVVDLLGELANTKK